LLAILAWLSAVVVRLRLVVGLADGDFVVDKKFNKVTPNRRILQRFGGFCNDLADFSGFCNDLADFATI
jgi:hypothetical protein